MRLLSSFTASKQYILGFFTILFLSSLSLSIRVTSRRGFVATASAFSQQNHKKLAFSSRTFSSKGNIFCAKNTAAMVESPPITRREEDRGTLFFSEFFDQYRTSNGFLLTSTLLFAICSRICRRRPRRMGSRNAKTVQ